MKKVFALLAMVSALAFVSCKKDDANKGGKGNKDKGKTEYVQPIKIDGDFADWAALDASKVATAKTDPDATHTALKLVKVYADELFIFVYFEWDTDQTDWVPDTDHVPFHVYINHDGDATTGGFSDQWSDACTDSCLEGFIYDANGIASYDPGVYAWEGEPNGSGWGWGEAVLADGSGLSSGAGVEGKYEFAILREMWPLGKIADNFSIGFDIQKAWNSVGVLPNAAPTDDNPAGTAPSLQVVTVK